MDFYCKNKGGIFHPGGLELTRRALEYCGFKEGAVISDIGCGTGESSRFIEKTFPVTVLSVEPSFGMSGGREGIISATAESLPFKQGFLDGAICECVLSLCQDLETALGELYRVIKPGGKLAVCDVYSKEGCFELAGPLKKIDSKERIYSALEKKGFEVLLFEDHSRELAKMAAKLIMEGKDCGDLYNHPQRKNMGYFLLIARAVKPVLKGASYL